jgi:hypothetical protein
VQDAPDVGPHQPALLDGGHHEAEVVGGQHHVGQLAGQLRPLAPHGHPDVGRAQGRAVVGAVAGHGHHLAVGLQGAHDGELRLRRDAGEDGHVAHQPPEGLVVQGAEVAGLQDA